MTTAKKRSESGPHYLIRVDLFTPGSRMRPFCFWFEQFRIAADSHLSVEIWETLLGEETNWNRIYRLVVMMMMI
jgi:hypothetical protein